MTDDAHPTVEPSDSAQPPRPPAAPGPVPPSRGKPHREDTMRPTALTLRRDFAASLVVFLVALPLCVGVAVASGVPAEVGLITGIVGGIVTGLLPGSSLQVSGPAAGLTVLVYEAVETYGLGALGVIVLASGLAQLALGALGFGRWFRAISISVVEGMLAGIGLVIIAGQLYAMGDITAPKTGLDKITGLPGLVGDIAGSGDALIAFAVGAGVVAILATWPYLPAKVRVVPGALAAVLLATGVTALADLSIAKVKVQGLLDSVNVPGGDDFDDLAQVGLIGTIVAFTLIASAESLFSAAAVDRLHDGPRTDYDKELMAQGAGNTLCGVLGALPMTAVIVRSSANVHAGAVTKASRVLHGVWLLLFAALLPAVIGLIPLAALAGVLVHAGWKLLPLGHLVPMWRKHRGEAIILGVTAISIVAVNMFEGVLIGLALSIIKTAWETSHIHTSVKETPSGTIRVSLTGNATFLRLPKMLDTLEGLPADRPIELDLSGLRHLDHACSTALTSWAERHNDEGTVPVRIAAEARVDGAAKAPADPKADPTADATAEADALPPAPADGLTEKERERVTA
ncbi:SulP family inorganic anion transporter [Streptomyces sp. AC536]|nr:SulP family inorganic anion transporter [Streptomyces buecherae]QNJ41881.1 SulP family inorganic anion transporter [Streptomyces buecherae]